MKCCVLTCKNYSDRRSDAMNGITFHVFPSEEKLKQQWITKINRQDWTPTKFTKICSCHFNDEDFEVTKKGLRKLKKGTLPCIKLDVSGRGDRDDDDNGATRSEQVLGPGFESSEGHNNLSFITIKDPTSQDEDNEPDLRALNEQALKITLARIQANPQLYIGIPKNCYHLIKILHQQTRIPTTHILLCLKKVKLDTHFEELADQFGISSDEASHIFITNLPVISKALQFFVNFNTQTNLPVPFQKYHSAIIDSLELNVQPLSFKSKELTRTEKGNTVKYLICRRPDGFINYVSSGYGGRLSNEAMLENTDYLKQFKPGTCFIANGFSNVEPILLEKGFKLVNPRADQSTESRQMCDKTQDPTSSIDHNRKPVKRKRVTEKTQNPTVIPQKPFYDHIERVVNPVGEFSMVKGCSVVRSDLLRVLDDAVVISCALLNLQSFVIN